MIPLYGFLAGDTIGLLILAEEGDTVAALVHKLQISAQLRVKPKAKAVLLHNGRTLDPQTTVAQAQMQALDRFDVVEASDP
jgi:hypothetical protein